jgi:predicted RNA-binding Zn ribbon-like protein
MVILVNDTRISDPSEGCAGQNDGFEGAERTAMSHNGKHRSDLSLSGVWLCLDFANTLSERGGGHPQETIGSYPDLAAWAQQAAVLTSAEAQRLIEAASGQPALAAVALKRAVNLRESIYRIFAMVADGQPPDAADLPVLNALIAQAQTRRQLIFTPAGFRWVWVPEKDRLDLMLWPIALSAGELLTSARLGRVRRCADEDCGWLYVDTSPGRSRR